MRLGARLTYMNLQPSFPSPSWLNSCLADYLDDFDELVDCADSLEERVADEQLRHHTAKRPIINGVRVL